MHARKTARDALFPSKEDDAFFAPRRGDIVFRDSASVRTFADRLNRGESRSGEQALRPAELGAMALMHEVLHTVVQLYREQYPGVFRRFIDAIREKARGLVLDFLARFPPPPVYRTQQGEGDDTPTRYLERAPDMEVELDEELLLLWVTNQNPAYEKVRTIVSDHDLGPTYAAFVEEAKRFFDEGPRFGPRGQTLVDLLLAPGRLHPTSIFAQVEFVERSWGETFGLDQFSFWRDAQRVHDLKAEEDRWFFRGGPGPGEPKTEAMTFARRPEDEPAQFSPDLGWMPNVVLMAKSVYVWLDQLSKKYSREIHRLDQIPDEELDLLASWNMTGLWLIGLFERSRASRRVKQIHGDTDALASAYSLASYAIASELGGFPAYENLKQRAWKRGIRLAADMVPNHVGIDGDWVIHHPDWFVQAPRPPYPAYRFGGPELSDDPRISVTIEEGYWNRTDAAVVFRRLDRWTGEERFIYHGNDGTSMPWNDTAQLDYLKAEVRHAVIETILHVARMFPIIRFDAAMTLAKRHIQRLWFPLKGNTAEAIPSRGDYALTQEEFDALIPVEFWREVVDVVAERAPDTLLLAEAFWMLEGYFVRTLGMHRVYNSAFMNMLKRQENEKYKATITNVLDFDPEILKRFVNFMNNPDEETAIRQFGDGDRYFGVCILMSTMPGLPMFGHGQVEGLAEKYGMEYRRARSGEQPDPHLVARHEREVMPVLAKRYLFSGVENFALYDFISGGQVDHDVYAYTNGARGERALVLFNNSFKSVRGGIVKSTHRGTVGEELALDEDRGWWLVIRDLAHGLDYLRPTKDVLDGGLAWELGGFQYHVLTGFRHVTATLERPYDRLAAELAGRGVPDIDFAVRELYLRPVHAPLREACSKGHLAYLGAQLEAPTMDRAKAALEERLGHVVDGLDWMLTQRSQRDVTVDRVPSIEGATTRFASLRGLLRATRPEREEEAADAEPAGAKAADPKAEAPAGAKAADAGAPADAKPEAPADAKPEAKEADPKAEAPADAKAADPKAEAPAGAKEADPKAEAPADAKEADAKPAEGRLPSAPPEPPYQLDLLISLIQVEAVIDLLAAGIEAFEEARSRPPAYLSARPPVVFRPPTPSEREAQVEAAATTDPSPTPDASTASADTAATAPVSPAAEPAQAPAPASPAPAPAAPAPLAPDTEPSVADLTASADRPSPPPIEVVPAANVPTTFEPPREPAPAPDVPWRTRESLVEEWHLATPLREAYRRTYDDAEAERRCALVLLGATLPKGPLAPAIRLALGTRRGQLFLHVHESGGTYWLNRERYEELVRFVMEREVTAGRLDVAAATAEQTRLVETALEAGYRAERIAHRLGPPPNVEPSS